MRVRPSASLWHWLAESALGRRDAAMIALLKNSRSRDLEAMIAHAQPNYSRPKDALPAGVSFASDNTYSSGPSFFERLFGDGETPTAGRNSR